VSGEQDFGGLIHPGRLTEFLDDKLPGQDQPLTISRIEGGTSNELFRLERAGQRWALRRPPKVPVSPTAHDMAREYRVLTALEGTDVPHAQPVAFCKDKAVLGADFYVMEFIDGFTMKDPLPPPFDADTTARVGLGFEMADAIARLACVDWKARGLDGFGRPEGFLERQVSRWLGQLEKYQTRVIPGMERVAKWLGENMPTMGPPGILHGDYQFINVLFHHGKPARLAAIVDWEQATIGDPLLDLGWLLAGWADPGEPPFWTTYLTQREGLPSRAQLAERYARLTGRSVDKLPYYLVLSLFKAACILEGHYTRYKQGLVKNPALAGLEHAVPGYIAKAEMFMRGA